MAISPSTRTGGHRHLHCNEIATLRSQWHEENRKALTRSSQGLSVLQEIPSPLMESSDVRAICPVLDTGERVKV